MLLYETLASACEHHDVFLNYSGINVHPEFVEQLPTFNVFSCFDDPESSGELSKPAAHAYDLAMAGNIAEVESYTSWRVPNPKWWPLGFRATDYDPRLRGSDILTLERDVDLALLCERQTSHRRTRLDRIVHAFPHGRFYGRGWPAGFLPEKERVPLLQRTKVGLNLHNSTGPVNFRTYYLPANGVLQICDNKKHLGKLYELGKEVIGFDSIDEGVELCRYYLAHDCDRREIAARGWERAVRDYNEVACFGRLISEVQATLKSKRAIVDKREPLVVLRRHSASARRRHIYRWASGVYLHVVVLLKRVLRRLRSYSVTLFR